MTSKILKLKAREIVSKAIKNKILIPKPCEICRNQKTDAHHNDYSKPLDVVWLCRKHHIDLHLGKKLEKNYVLKRSPVIQTIVIEFKNFLHKRPCLSPYGFEQELKLPNNTLFRALSGERMLPKKHFQKLYFSMKHYGYGSLEGENYIYK